MELTAPTLSLGLDRPVGRIDAIPSGITGKVIEYFTPDPLPDLIKRCFEIKPPEREQRDPLSGLLLLRVVSRNSSGGVDIGQARRLFGVLQGRRLSRREDFFALGAEISRKAGTLRKEIVFVGGKAPSSARHIYAFEEALPFLMASLETGLNSEHLQTLDPLFRSAIVGLFCVYTHPFRDGNGKWSRLMSLSTARSASDIWPSLACVAFSSSCKSLLSNKIWPEARSGGLRSYLELAIKFERSIDGSIARVGFHDLVKELDEDFTIGNTSARQRHQLLGGLFATGHMPADAVRKVLNLSQPAAKRCLQNAASRSEFLSFGDGVLEANDLLRVIEEQIEAASKELA